ncbi:MULTISPECIES: hypothetical protein [unclassified Blastococcus]
MGRTGPSLRADSGEVERPRHTSRVRRAHGWRFTVGSATSRLWHGLLRRPGDRHELIRIRPA